MGFEIKKNSQVLQKEKKEKKIILPLISQS